MNRQQHRVGLRQPPPRRRWQRWAAQVRRFLLRLFGWSGWPRVASLATAAAAVAALYFSGQSLRATGKQYGLSEQGQVADRFTKSIEQLGSDKLDVRLGGIYSLERLTRDSLPDRAVVFEVLGAYVRAHAPDTPECEPSPGTPIIPGLARPVDIQAALTVIGRRTVSRDSRGKIDLRSTCLYGADLTGAHLDGANLDQANLAHAWLASANLTGAFLMHANLTAAYLSAGSFEHPEPQGLDGANLTGADLGGANLYRAYLAHAWLGSAILGDADLVGADLEGAHLDGAHLDGANLTGADLKGAHLDGANLTGANLDDIYYEHSTTWPDGFIPPPSRRSP
jgi:hypothetical protein